jgi:hypothetical protein
VFGRGGVSGMVVWLVVLRRTGPKPCSVVLCGDRALKVYKFRSLKFRPQAEWRSGSVS